MQPANPMTFGQRLLGIFSIVYLLGFLWPGGFVGRLFMGLGAFILACVSYLVWSFLN